MLSCGILEAGHVDVSSVIAALTLRTGEAARMADTKYKPIEVGARYGRLVVLDPGPAVRAGKATCICDCGKTCTPQRNSLRAGHTLSCGCLARENSVKLGRSGMTHGKSSNPEFWAWHAMRQRCENANHPEFFRYGARGITVCERWKKSDNFLDDMGPKPSPRHSLERTNNSLGYSPENCKWATPDVQSRNTRRNRMITFEGRTQIMTDWAIEKGLRPDALWSRLSSGWSLAEAMQPSKRRNPKRKD